MNAVLNLSRSKGYHFCARWELGVTQSKSRTLTLNQRVLGSSPSASTIFLRYGRAVRLL